MIWIPVVFLCMVQGCGFMQGEGTYSEQACTEHLEKVVVELQAAQQRGEVFQFSATCVVGNSI